MFVPEEREWLRAAVESGRFLPPMDPESCEALLDRSTPLVFHCHHGPRSQAAAEHFARLGFTEVYNLVGGIDAWSREIDSRVPRY